MKYGSVCSGIEAASVAWESLGWKPAWFSEIEPFPSAVLAHHWPEVSNLGDMTVIAARIAAGEVEAPDILVGGTPCQAFSVAGLRNGLEDARGQLTLSFVELANAIDTRRANNEQPPALIVWENVPGVLSSKDNAFGCFLAGLAGESSELLAPGGKWSNAGCVYGPARIVAWRVLDAQFFGVAQRRKRVFVVASARNGFDPAAVLFELEGMRRDTPPRREPQSSVAALTANGVGTCGADDNQGQAGHLIAFGGGNTSGSIDVAACLTAKGQRQDFDVETFALAFAENSRGELRLQNSDGNITGPLSTGGGKPGQGMPAVISEPFTIAIRGRAEGSSVEVRNDGTSNALLTPNGGRAGMGVGAISWGMQVRRLTPVECERLQGFPDDHTLISWRGKDAIDCPDGPRYRAIGNSMAVPVMRWIGERIAAALPVVKTIGDYGGSTTPPEHRDSWQTPPEIFAALNRDFRFVADVAASEHNHLLPVYFTEKDDALEQDWAGQLPIGFAWCNPPYSDISPWVKKAAEEWRKGIGTVMLVPADTSVGWFSLARGSCTEVRFIIDGRLSFIRADTGKPVNGNNKGSMLLIWNPFVSDFGITGYVSRDTLMAIGRKLLSDREPVDEHAA